MATDNSTESSAPPSGEPKSKKAGWTWDRTLEMAKILATLYAACLGTFVTMQFNERQHELARIEAIAKMLPSLAAKEAEQEQRIGSPVFSSTTDVSQGKKNIGKGAGGAASNLNGVASATTNSNASAASTGSPSSSSSSTISIPSHAAENKQRMVRDGAIWAIFRTAQNKNMLRDLANLFPEDIYRVVSSIAASGGLEHDEDEIMALQIASEKLANKYMDENDTIIATKLYNQALRLKQRLRGQNEALYIVDLNDRNVEELPDEAASDRQAYLLSSLNKLGELHSQDSEESHKVNTGHFQSKQLYNRVRTLGKNAKESGARLEVAKADQGLALLYEKEHRYKTALYFLNDAHKIEKEVHGERGGNVPRIESEMSRLKALAPR